MRHLHVLKRRAFLVQATAAQAMSRLSEAEREAASALAAADERVKAAEGKLAGALVRVAKLETTEKLLNQEIRQLTELLENEKAAAEMDAKGAEQVRGGAP